ncbi:MAG: permease [Bacteroidales bacterium]|nr:permease [Bacteroidales bacterium]
MQHNILSGIESPVALKRIGCKAGIYLSIFLLMIDFIYKSWNGISYQNREICIVYNLLPSALFLIYEYFIELFLVVIAGVFVAVILERQFAKHKQFFPKNQLSAFIYASVIPVCSCSAIPMIETMKDKLKFRTIITFVVAAPLLNPYIVLLSFSILGIKYGILRICTSLVLAMVTGLVVEYFYNKSKNTELGKYNNCSPTNGCGMIKKNIYEDTYNIVKKIFPYLLIAGALSLVFEIYNPAKIMQHYYLGDSWLGTILVVILGVPVYFCNGADVVFLQPLMKYAGLSIGSSIAFSLTSTSVCISSLIMLIKFIGRRLTFILLGTVVLLTVIMGLIISLLM